MCTYRCGQTDEDDKALYFPCENVWMLDLDISIEQTDCWFFGVTIISITTFVLSFA